MKTNKICILRRTNNISIFMNNSREFGRVKYSCDILRIVDESLLARKKTAICIMHRPLTATRDNRHK